jgi:hypothetical protein
VFEIKNGLCGFDSVVAGRYHLSVKALVLSSYSLFLPRLQTNYYSLIKLEYSRKPGFAVLVHFLHPVGMAKRNLIHELSRTNCYVQDTPPVTDHRPDFGPKIGDVT